MTDAPAGSVWLNDDDDDGDDDSVDDRRDDDDDERGQGDDGGGGQKGQLAAGVLEYLARSIVDEPDEVSIEFARAPRGGTVLRLFVAPGDVGKVIGRRGRTAGALRALARAAGAKEDADILVDIAD